MRNRICLGEAAAVSAATADNSTRQRSTHGEEPSSSITSGATETSLGCLPLPRPTRSQGPGAYARRRRRAYATYLLTMRAAAELYSSRQGCPIRS